MGSTAVRLVREPSRDEFLTEESYYGINPVR